MSRYYKATEVDEFLNKVGKGNCNLCAFYDDCNSRGLNRKGSHRYCWQAKRFITPDVEEVVRCKDCKHLMFSDMYGECSKAHMGIVRPDDFCSYAERKEGD